MQWFNSFADAVVSLSAHVHEFLWGTWFLVLLLGTHLFFTFRTGFIQKKIFLGIKLSIQKDSQGAGDVSPFGALTTALAATVGTANIVGVATAINLGGPGAVLWMWLTGVFGIATKYAESLVAIKYRVKTSDGTMLGGAMYALERLSISLSINDKDKLSGSLKRPIKHKISLKFLGVLFAFFGAIAAFGIGNGVQANAVATNLESTFSIVPWLSGLIIAILTGLVIIGGVKNISKVCVKFVPTMAIVYCLSCFVILAMNIHYIFPAIKLIVESAFTPSAAGGGFVGASVIMAMRFGIARGLFSNESGMGSAAIIAAAAKSRNPFRQALISSTGTFWDTVVICAITGLTLVASIVAHPTLIGDPQNVDGGLLTNIIFSQIPYIGPICLTFGLLTFAFSTILGWSYYGEKCAEFLFGKKITLPYRIAFVIVVFIGATIPLDLAWEMADSLNALMVMPNLVAILLLSNLISKETKYYLKGNHIDEFDTEPIPLYEEKR
ncbi:MAG: sodium:alanine symporter family protein [Elusimicrobiota bacterium]|jgi:AGCS family alanine or glycine:cation symporter|nr:sodium:alanine symporter family protein [Elusimicrobiota bacterium]